MVNVSSFIEQNEMMNYIKKTFFFYPYFSLFFKLPSEIIGAEIHTGSDL